MTRRTKSGLDETFLGLMMHTIAMVDAAIFLGPWGSLKTAAYAFGSVTWWLFAVGFLVFALVAVPGLFSLAVLTTLHLEGKDQPFQHALANYTPTLLPLGLSAWMAFTHSFIFTKFAYILPVISDPFGWGWNLLGLKNSAATGEIPSINQILQSLILIGGMMWFVHIARRRSASAWQIVPLLFFIGGCGIAMLWLLIG